MSGNIVYLRPKAPRVVPPPSPPALLLPEPWYAYETVMLAPEVSVGQLLHALRFSGIVISTHPESGQTYIHRSPTPPNAA